MTMLLIVLLPFLAIGPVWFAARFSRNASFYVAATTTGLGLGLLASLVPEVMAGNVFVDSWPWIERIGLNIAFRMDGLAMLFCILILGIGLMVVIYAKFYLTEDDPIGPFYAMLMTFMGAMLGVVTSENLLLLAMFWELTSISSFLLIGYWRHLPAARQGARLALMITGSGGLFLLAGVLLLQEITGSLELSVVLASGPQILDHDLYWAALICVLMGAFTKSAQFPFHFWLPNAMTAPTPVSAYLHSATMVKAGVFLLARLHPAMSGSPEWFFLVTGAGLTTLAFAAYVALFKHDLKGLLAYSTISHLGIITACLGMSTKWATIAAVFHIMNHAAFKASLFMSAGIVDHECGTRDARLLSGLRHSMPITFGLATLGALAMGGAPFFNGFLSKEMFFKEAYTLSQAHPYWPDAEYWAWIFPVVATVGGLFSVAYSVRFIHDVFFGPEAHDLPKHPHDPPFGMWLPVAILVAVCVVVGVVPMYTAESFLYATASPVTGYDMPEALHLHWWHGLVPELYMTLVAIAAGIGVYTQWKKIAAIGDKLPTIVGKDFFESFIEMLIEGARALDRLVDNQSLQRYMAYTISFATLAGFMAYIEEGWQSGTGVQTPASLVSLVPVILLIAGAFMTDFFQRKRLVSLIFMSVVGLIVSLMFIYFSAPDLGLTQISVEVVTVLLLLLALFVLPQWNPVESGWLRRSRDILVAASAGIGVGALAWGVMTRQQQTIADYYLAESLPKGGGTNVVNVILVDFRGFDTMGEVSVLALASVGIIVMLTGKKPLYPNQVMPFPEERFPLMLTSVTRVLVPTALLVAFYIFMRGHNLPGGGFIAGLVAVVALAMQFVASGLDWTKGRFKLDLVRLSAIGVLLAVGTGLAAFVWGRPFLTSGMLHLHPPGIGEVHIASAMAFDTGVFLVVVGSLVLIIRRLSRYQQTMEVQDKAGGNE